MEYNADNIFAKIIRGEIPTDIVYEDEFALAFNDINPKAPIHVLVIPKGMFTDYSDLMAHGSDEEIIGFTRAIARVIDQLEIEKDGYRLVFNTGFNSGQEVPHVHAHILAGAKLGVDVGIDSQK